MVKIRTRLAPLLIGYDIVI